MAGQQQLRGRWLQCWLEAGRGTRGSQVHTACTSTADGDRVSVSDVTVLIFLFVELDQANSEDKGENKV